MPVFFRFITFTFIRHIYKIAKVSVCPSTWNSLAPTGQIFMKFLYMIIFQKYIKKIQVFIKICKELELLYMKTYVRSWEYVAKFFLEWEIFQTKVV